MMVRKPSWGNQFYPADPVEARAMWGDFFSRCQSPRISESIRAVQVPHAGWVYSGQAAAEAFNQLKDRDIKSVILIGPQHRVPVRHMQVYPQGTWESPLGNLEVDAELAERFIAFNDAFRPDPESHQSEHSLEVQIPPLVLVLPQVSIIPILMAPYQRSHTVVLADALAEIVGTDPEILTLVSTDLYHGESYDSCQATDAYTIQLINSMDYKGLEEALANGSAAACGGDGMVGLLYAAQRLGISKAHQLAAYNSNDIMGVQGGYVVGYSSFVFTGG